MKNRSRRIFAAIGLLALTILVLTNFGRLEQFLSILTNMRWYLLGLVVGVQLVSYYANAMYYQSFFEIFNYKLDLRRLYKTALVINFVNQAFPAGAISGFSYLSSNLGQDVPAGKTSLAQLMRYVFTFASYFLVLTLGFLLLFISGNLSQVASRLTMLILLAVIIVGLLAFVLIADRPRVEKLALGLISSINKLTKRWRKRPLVTSTQLAHYLEEFYHGYEILRSEKGHWVRPALYALLGNIAEVLTVGVVLWALGVVVNPGIVIAAYTLANIASLASPITGGAGVYEVTMVATFVAMGLASSVAVSTVLVYRVFNLAFFLPIGYYFYRQDLVGRK